MHPAIRDPPAWQHEFDSAANPTKPQPQEPDDTSECTMLTPANLQAFRARGGTRAVLFTALDETPEVWNRVASANRAHCSFWSVRASEAGLLAEFGVERRRLPRIICVREDGSTAWFGGAVSLRALSTFIGKVCAEHPSQAQGGKAGDGHSRFGIFEA